MFENHWPTSYPFSSHTVLQLNCKDSCCLPPTLVLLSILLCVVIPIGLFKLFPSLDVCLLPNSVMINNTIKCCYQEEEHAVVVVGVVFKVHVESSIHMAQVMMIVQLSETLIGELGMAVEALE